MGIVGLGVVRNTVFAYSFCISPESTQISVARCMAAQYLERPEHPYRNPHAPILNAEERRFVVQSDVG